MGQFEAAAASFQEFIRLQPKSADAYNNLGVSYFKLEEYRKAVECLTKAVSPRPDYAEVFYNLGEAYCALKNKEAALEQHAKLQTLNHNLAVKLFNLIHQ